MLNFWLSGLSGLMQESEAQLPNSRAASAAAVDAVGLRRELGELRHHVQKMALMNQALWELIRDRLNLSDEDLARVVHEVDLRDGIEDGAVTHGPLRCPQCGRVSNSRHYKCLYCGLQFEKPVTG